MNLSFTVSLQLWVGCMCMRCQQDCLRHMCRPAHAIRAGCSLTSAAGAQLGVTWGISATRVVNNKHHVADVLAGMLLGGTIATVFALRAIPRVRCAARAPTFPALVCDRTSSGWHAHKRCVALSVQQT